MFQEEQDLYNYGKLEKTKNEIDLGAGQPDIIFDEDGENAIISTHFEGSDYGLKYIPINSINDNKYESQKISINGTGFTGGLESPDNFPIESAAKDKYIFTAQVKVSL